MLPGLLIIGAQKAGTTSLYHYLAAHRQVLPGTEKEVRYFNSQYHRGISWYRSHFPLNRQGRGERLGGDPITLDASTGYLFSRDAPGRVAADLPDAKFVVLLRDPVERAWSHYRHSVRDGHEALPFAEALAAEEKRLEQHYLMCASGDPDDRVLSFHSYISRGRYHEQLVRWFSVLDRTRFLILKSEEFFKTPLKTTNEVLGSLGLSPLVLEGLTIYNAGSNEEIPPKERDLLRTLFEPYNERLYELLDWPPDRRWPASDAD